MPKARVLMLQNRWALRIDQRLPKALQLVFRMPERMQVHRMEWSHRRAACRYKLSAKIARGSSNLRMWFGGAWSTLV
jgi:hypothetical protein